MRPAPDIRCLPADESVQATVAAWLYGKWGPTTGRRSPAGFLPGLRGRVDCTRIPFTLVAFDEKEPVGTASLFVRDMDTHEHLSPWLAAVYVRPDKRRQGIGRRLCEAATARAEALGVRRAYLFTPDKEVFYGYMGWKPVEAAWYRSERVIIMTKLLCDGE